MFAWLFPKSYNEQIKDFEQKITTITTSLVKQQDQSELAALLDPEKCNQYTLFLGSELDKRFKKVELEELNTQIYVVKRPKKTEKNNNMNIDNYKGTDKNYSKQELCTKIASHYIRTFNIISAILTAINPEGNMCSRRLKALYDTTSDTDTGYVKICKSDDTDLKNKLYPDTIDEIPGIKQLLNLYYFYLMQDNINPEQKNRIERDFVLLRQALSNVYASTTDIPLSIKNVEASLNRSIASLNKVKGVELDEKLAELTALVSELKEQINNFKQNPNPMINEINHKINDKLQMFEGNIEEKIQALEKKITATVQKHEFNNTGQGNVIQQNFRENQITDSLKNTLTQEDPTSINLSNIQNNADMVESSRFDLTNKPSKSRSKPLTPHVGEFPVLPKLNHLQLSNKKGGNYINNNTQTGNRNDNLNGTNYVNQNYNGNNTNDNNTNDNTNSYNNVINNNQTDTNNQQSIIANFINFIENLNKNKQINPKYKLHLKPKTIEELSSYKCTSEPSNVVIKINDAKFSDFKAIYEKMKSHYNNSSSSLIGILESKLLNIKDNEYVIKPLNNAQLNEIQHQVMVELVNYYTKCQELYDSSFNSLAKALEQ